jgi:hypothetical protein
METIKNVTQKDLFNLGRGKKIIVKAMNHNGVVFTFKTKVDFNDKGNLSIYSNTTCKNYFTFWDKQYPEMVKHSILSIKY